VGRAYLGLVLLGACSFSDGARPSIDARVNPPIDGAIDAYVPDAAVCAMKSAECIGDTLRQCTGPGAIATDKACGWGCDATGDGSCKHVVPSASALTVADAQTATGLTDVILIDGYVLDTEMGRIGTTGNPTQIRGAGTGVINGIDFQLRPALNANDPAVGVFRFRKLTIQTTSTGSPLSFAGVNAVAIVSLGDFVIDGTIDARGTCAGASGGPGGYSGGTSKGPGNGPGGGGSNATNKYAGGGGGHGGVGGQGGSDTVGTFVPGGIVNGDSAITILRGGSGGGGGAGAAAAGGGGGGAIQLVSNTLISIPTGGINAGGCGGKSKAGGNDGGGGGGAGGTILLEAPLVTFGATAKLAVNGGGGAGGDTDVVGAAQDGQLSRVAALGTAGGNMGANGGAGGDGAAAAMANGSDGASLAGKPGGGGGGAVGRIRINTRQDAGLTLQPGTELSPNFADSSSCTRGEATIQ
jgi:hypothetical protein